MFKKPVKKLSRNKKNWVMLVLGLFWGSSFAQQVNIGLEFRALDLPGYDTAKADGWVVLFDGTQASMENWWLGPRHGGEGRWWLAPDNDTQSDKFWTLNASDTVMWSDQMPGGVGGVLMTHRRYTDIETKVWCKPGWNNDGGIFLRTNSDAYAWQVVIDYENGARIGELYDEGSGYSGTSRVQTYDLRNNGTEIDPPNRFPVPWLEMWDPNGYNEFWAKVTGRPVHIESKINGIDVLDWQANGIGSRLDDDGHLGLQIHSGEDSWNGGPNKYTWVEVNELDENTGEQMYPVITTSPESQEVPENGTATFSYVSSAADVTIQWQKNGVDIPGASQPEYTISPVAASDAGSYTVILEDNGNKRVTRSDPGILTVGPASSIRKQNIIYNIRANWENSGSLKVAGVAKSSQTLQILNTNGRILAEAAVKEGTFIENFNLDNNGIYLITIKGDPSFTPIVVSQINN